MILATRGPNTLILKGFFALAVLCGLLAGVGVWLQAGSLQAKLAGAEVVGWALWAVLLLITGFAGGLLTILGYRRGFRSLTQALEESQGRGIQDKAQPIGPGQSGFLPYSDALVQTLNSTLISGQHQLVTSMAELHSNTNALLSQIPVGTCKVGVGGVIQPGHSSALGRFFARESLAGELLIQLLQKQSNLSKDRIQRMEAALDAILNGNHFTFASNVHIFPTQLILSYTKPNGRSEFRNVSMTWMPVYSQGAGRIVEELFLIMEDLSQQKALENQVKALEGENVRLQQVLKVGVPTMREFAAKLAELIRKIYADLDNAGIHDLLISTLSLVSGLKHQAQEEGIGDFYDALRGLEKILNSLDPQAPWQKPQKEAVRSKVEHCQALLEDYKILTQVKTSRDTRLMSA